MKLLLVDDDADQLELRSLTLANAGFDTHIASDEVTALRIADEQRPTIAVLDLRLPSEQAGLHLIHSLKKQHAAIQIIVLTGSDPKRFEGLPERSLVDAVLTKGNASRQLLERLMQKKLEAEGQMVLDVKVIPRSSQSEVMQILSGGVMKVKLAAVPEQGKANEELIALLANYFQVRKQCVELISGTASQRKKVRIRANCAT